VAWALASSACGGGGGGGTSRTAGAAGGTGAAGSAGGTAGAGAASPLQAACGRKIVLQTDWYPEPEHGGAYQLAGPSGRVDRQRGTYTGRIDNTGVELEIRAGGPFIGNQAVSSLMYQDPSILMGYVSTDEAVQQSAKLPTVAVMATLAASPSMLMWDPARYDFKTLADIGRSNAKVLSYEGTAFITYLVGKGVIRRDQVDSSYDGSPSRFVSEGNLVQQGFATNEPYKYEHDIPQWHKPVAFALISTSGYNGYPQNIAVRPETVRDKADCLRALVPLMQQAQVDYMRNPQPVNDALVRMVQELASSWTLSPDATADAVRKMHDLGIVANSPDGALGSFDLPRLEAFLAILRALYTEQKLTTMKPGVAPADVATNDFIDKAIHL
jgi:hypothetical protein